MQNKDYPKLRTCPFCGGEAKLNMFLGNYCVTCINCLGGIIPAPELTIQEAIEAWNRRVGEE